MWLNCSIGDCSVIHIFIFISGCLSVAVDPFSLEVLSDRWCSDTAIKSTPFCTVLKPVVSNIAAELSLWILWF